MLKAATRNVAHQRKAPSLSHFVAISFSPPLLRLVYPLRPSSSHMPSAFADAFAIPEGLASEHAAPLFCGGITVYSPLVDHDAVGKRVGIAGIGGLGSMAIQFSRCVLLQSVAYEHHI